MLIYKTVLSCRLKMTSRMETLTTPDYDDSTMCNIIDLNDFSKTYLPPLYYIIFIISLVGNGVVLCIMYKFEKLNTVTNIFLLNLIASNIVFTFTLPFQAVSHSDEWIFGEMLCKLVNGCSYLGFYSSILFLTLMTFDRYLAVVHSVVANRQRRSCYAVLLSVIVWCVSLAASLDLFVHFTVNEDNQMGGLVCEDPRESHWKMFALYKQFVLFFLFPLAVFVYCYSRIIITVISTRIVGKHRTVRLIFIIVLMFFAFWSPYNIILLIHSNKNPKECDDSLEYPLRITNNIARLYFCINPFFYTFLGKKFQNHVRRVLANKFVCLTQYESSSAEQQNSSLKITGRTDNTPCSFNQRVH
ncbi:C-C chemokine receptor type 3 [Misgurnus anguillicaudatus]|uniref:C-C chemokine receptor type 3 n=1 Tax=Misgurnus anguillicaudatus TaxID=75329 RepID=UPI003CCFA642